MGIIINNIYGLLKVKSFHGKDKHGHLLWNCECECGEELNSHHLYSFNLYPDLRFDINNGITLCKKCHTLTHNKFGIHTHGELLSNKITKI